MANTRKNISDRFRILGVANNGNSPCFICEDGKILENYKGLVNYLSRPHSHEIEVRMFDIVYPLPLCGLADYEQEEIDDMFYYLRGVGGIHPPVVHPDFVFELFWHASNCNHW